MCVRVGLKILIGCEVPFKGRCGRLKKRVRPSYDLRQAKVMRILKLIDAAYKSILRNFIFDMTSLLRMILGRHVMKGR